MKWILILFLPFILSCTSFEKKINIGEIIDLSKKEYSYDVVLPRNLSGWWFNIRPDKVNGELLNTIIKVELINRGKSDLEIFNGEATITVKPNIQTVIFNDTFEKLVLAGRTLNFYSNKEDISIRISIVFKNTVPLDGPISIYALQSDSL